MADRLDHSWATLRSYGVEPEDVDDTAPELAEDGETDAWAAEQHPEEDEDLMAWLEDCPDWRTL